VGLVRNKSFGNRSVDYKSERGCVFTACVHRLRCNCAPYILKNFLHLQQKFVLRTQIITIFIVTKHVYLACKQLQALAAPVLPTNCIQTFMAIYRLEESKPTTIIIADETERIAFGVASVLAHHNVPFSILLREHQELLAPFEERIAMRVDDLPALSQMIIDCTWFHEYEEAPLDTMIKRFPYTPVVFASPCATSIALQKLYNIPAAVRFNAAPGFFPTMRRVELAPSATTSPEVLHYVVRYFHLLGFETEIVGDVVGLVAPRVVSMIINEAAFAVMERVATPHDIDAAMKLGTNYPHGPLEWADDIGLDHVVLLLDALYNEYHQERYRVCPLLRQYVRAERLGKLMRQGFYDYDASGRKMPK